MPVSLDESEEIKPILSPGASFQNRPRWMDSAYGI